MSKLFLYDMENATAVIREMNNSSNDTWQRRLSILEGKLYDEESLVEKRSRKRNSRILSSIIWPGFRIILNTEKHASLYNQEIVVIDVWGPNDDLENMEVLIEQQNLAHKFANEYDGFMIDVENRKVNQLSKENRLLFKMNDIVSDNE